MKLAPDNIFLLFMAASFSAHLSFINLGCALVSVMRCIAGSKFLARLVLSRMQFWLISWLCKAKPAVFFSAAWIIRWSFGGSTPKTFKTRSHLRTPMTRWRWRNPSQRSCAISRISAPGTSTGITWTAASGSDKRSCQRVARTPSSVGNPATSSSGNVRCSLIIIKYHWTRLPSSCSSQAALAKQ